MASKLIGISLLLFAVVFFIIIVVVIVALIYMYYRKAQKSSYVYNVPLQVFQQYGVSSATLGKCIAGSVIGDVFTAVCTTSQGVPVVTNITLENCAANASWTLNSSGVLSCSLLTSDASATDYWSMTPCSMQGIVSNSPSWSWLTPVLGLDQLGQYCSSANIAGVTWTQSCGVPGANNTKVYNLDLSQCGVGPITYQPPSAANGNNGGLYCSPGFNFC